MTKTCVFNSSCIIAAHLIAENLRYCRICVGGSPVSFCSCYSGPGSSQSTKIGYCSLDSVRKYPVHRRIWGSSRCCAVGKCGLVLVQILVLPITSFSAGFFVPNAVKCAEICSGELPRSGVSSFSIVLPIWVSLHTCS
jgi:hypothetical protein